MDWIKSIQELQAIAQAGLYYTKDRFDEERFERIRELCLSMMASLADLPKDKVADLFCNESGYQTPKIDTRAVIVKDNRVLLVQEGDGKWALPGGWCDVNCSIKENTLKEVKEEAGLDVCYERLLAVLDRDKHNQPPYAYGVIKFFSLCMVTGGQFEKNIETIDSRYFGLDELPELAIYKVNEAQLRLCFELINSGEIRVD